MKKAFIAIFVIAALTIGCGSDHRSGKGYETTVREEIDSAMEDQVGSWNSDELAGFMKYYWRSEHMTFHGNKSRLQGWEILNSMYEETYSGEHRGRLEFSGLEINVIAPEAAYVLGDWKVTLPDTVKQGKFTLIWRRMDGGWRIVHDHSS